MPPLGALLCSVCRVMWCQDWFCSGTPSSSRLISTRISTFPNTNTTQHRNGAAGHSIMSQGYLLVLASMYCLIDTWYLQVLMEFMSSAVLQYVTLTVKSHSTRYSRQTSQKITFYVFRKRVSPRSSRLYKDTQFIEFSLPLLKINVIF